MLLFVLLIAGIVNIHGALFVSKEKYNETLQVRTTKGIIQGLEDITKNGVSFFAFKGIPFAKPPLGNLRFKSPVPNKSWKGVLNGARNVPGCVESIIRLTNMSIQGEEDCLYLNVYTPQNPSAIKYLPVMLWFAGGAFLEGNSTLYGPHYFMEKNVILVTMNYRLGLFGFLSTEDEASPGNYGLKDQLAVLKWLNVNIRYFGGDSSRITIIGQSSGACSVMHHVIAKRSRGLFSGAIAMSGETLTPWCTQRFPLNVANDVGKALYLNTKNTTMFIDSLRRIDSDKLKEVQLNVALAHFGSIYFEGLPFTPTIEPEHKDAFITEPTYNLLKRGDFARVPVIIGRTSMELLLLTADEHCTSQEQTGFGLSGLDFDKLSSIHGYMVFALQKLFVLLVAMTVVLDNLWEVPNQRLPWLRAFCLLLDSSPSSIVDRFSIPANQKYRVGKMFKKRYFASGSATSGTAEEILQFATDQFFVVSMERTIQLLSQHTPVYDYIFSHDSKSSSELWELFFQLKPSKSIKDGIFTY